MRIGYSSCLAGSINFPSLQIPTGDFNPAKLIESAVQRIEFDLNS